MKKMFIQKKLIALMAIIGILFSLTSCNGSKKDVDIDEQAFIDEALNSGAYSADMTQVTEKNALRKYTLIDMDKIETMIVCLESAGAAADELTIIKVKNKEDIESIKAAIDDRKEKLLESVLSYNPSQVERINNELYKTEGNYIVIAVSDDDDKVEEIFDKYVKDAK